MSEANTEQTPAGDNAGVRIGEAPALGMSEQLRMRKAQQKTNTVLWGIFALLLVLVGIVIFVLPDYVERARPEVAATVPAAVPAATPAAAPGLSPFEEAQRLRQREAAQNTLASVLELQATLEQKQVLGWAETEFNAALAQARSGDEAYSTQQYEKANELYQAGLVALQQITTNEPAIYAAAMTAGADAYAAEDATAAQAAYQRALLLQPDSADAAAGLERALVLTDVVRFLDEGRKQQAAQELEAAREQYQQTVALDASHEGANAALREVNGAISQRNFSAAMSRGYAAMQAGEYEQALAGFKQAEALRPGAPEVASAIQQANDQQTVNAVTVYLEAATRYEASEEWALAVAEWDRALAIDPNLVRAQEGRKRSNSRNSLDNFLVTTINDPLRLSEASVLAQTAQVLADAARLTDAGPKLQGQLQQVRDAMERSQVPVNVMFQSDGLTAVTLYRVGDMGMFKSQNI
ncbi:MAG: hypothetical protein V4603_04415, partial [Pseudomonadota bacterium]